MEWYIDYSNGHDPFNKPRSQWKYWIKQGMDVLTNITNKETEMRQREASKPHSNPLTR